MPSITRVGLVPIMAGTHLHACLIELPENEGPSITNACESVGQEALRYLPGQDPQYPTAAATRSPVRPIAGGRALLQRRPRRRFRPRAARLVVERFQSADDPPPALRRR